MGCEKLSDSLRKQKDIGTCNAPHLIVEARAGTGKTVTMIEGVKFLKGLPTAIKPSSQQQAIWDCIAKSRDKVQTICYVAFNKPIAVELQQRVPVGCQAMTMHSMGLRAITQEFGQIQVVDGHVRDIMAELLGIRVQHLRCKKPEVLRATEKLVGLCKTNLVGDSEGVTAKPVLLPTNPQLADIAAHYDVDLNGYQDEVFALVPHVLERCKDVAKDSCIDFNDMIWLPIALNLTVQKYDLLLVDECQDLNRCQQQLALKAGRRLILVGDSRQSIYGFAGADSQSMERMRKLLESPQVVRAVLDEYTPDVCRESDGYAGTAKSVPHRVRDKHRNCRCVLERPPCPACKGKGSVEQIFKGASGLVVKNEQTRECSLCNGKGFQGRGCVTLPLTVTRRCGKAIVDEARKIVPDFEAHPDNGEGKIWSATFADKAEFPNQAYYGAYAQDGDMILCRVNAPLVSECFKFLKAGRKANIQGRDVGQGLISTVRKLTKMERPSTGGAEVGRLISALDIWLCEEEHKENAKHNPSEARLIALQDRRDCLFAFCEDQQTVAGVIAKIEAVFTDDKESVGIRLSSVHRAKGLESNRVFILLPENAGMPHPLARSAWQKEEEQNILYVAITRAIKELVWVS